MKSTSNPDLFFNIHGIGIVTGGLVVTGFASFPGAVLWSTLKSSFQSLHVKSRVNAYAAEEVFRIATAYRKGLSSVEAELDSIQNRRVREATNLILEGINKDSVVEILDKRIDEARAATHLEANVCMTLGKYSPALGLAATTLGLVDLLSKLSDADLGALGYGMAIALSGTFYGILFANVIFIPLSELLTSGREIEAKEDQMIRDGFESLLAGRDPIIVGEIMNSYIGESDRINFSKLKGNSEKNAGGSRRVSA
jgi:chemotaxis protein MotA